MGLACKFLNFPPLFTRRGNLHNWQFKESKTMGKKQENYKIWSIVILHRTLSNSRSFQVHPVYLREFFVDFCCMEIIKSKVMAILPRVQSNVCFWLGDGYICQKRRKIFDTTTLLNILHCTHQCT